MQVEIRRHSVQNPWSYAELDARQREIARGIREGSRQGAVLLSEVRPVITLGRRANESEEIRLPPESLERLGIDVYRTDRGGLATWHGPGQWVLFVVERLDRLTGDRKGVRRAVEGLLEIGRRTVEQAWGPVVSLDRSLEIRSGCETGIWSRVGKLASVGVQIEQGVLLHGLALNVSPSPLSFLGLRPCGLEGVSPDHVSTGAPEVDMDRVRELLLESVEVVFGTLEPGKNFRPDSGPDSGIDGDQVRDYTLSHIS